MLLGDRLEGAAREVLQVRSLKRMGAWGRWGGAVLGWRLPALPECLRDAMGMLHVADAHGPRPVGEAYILLAHELHRRVRCAEDCSDFVREDSLDEERELLSVRWLEPLKLAIDLVIREEEVGVRQQLVEVLSLRLRSFHLLHRCQQCRGDCGRVGFSVLGVGSGRRGCAGGSGRGVLHGVRSSGPPVRTMEQILAVWLPHETAPRMCVVTLARSFSAIPQMPCRSHHCWLR